MTFEDRTDRVEQHLGKLALNPRRLSVTEISRDYAEVSDVTAAWRVQLTDDAAVDVLISADYPYERAMIGIANTAITKSQPNIYTNGTLCLLKPHEGHSLEDNEDVLDELLARTRLLLRAKPLDRAERNSQEIVDYWKGSAAPGRLLLIEDIANRPHEVFFAKAGQFTAVGDCKESLRSWVFQYTGQQAKIERTALVVATLEFPTTIVSAKELHDWFVSEQPDQVALLESIATGERKNIPLLIAIPGSEGGAALLGCWIRKPLKKQIGKPNHVPGFRAGTVPGHIAAPYIFSPVASVEHARVDRANVEWLTARGGSGISRAITSVRLTLIGCGSLGSTVARLLIKGGVSHLRIIDPQLLEWDNIARHDLGGHWVGRSKAKSVAATLARDFPHVEIEAIHDNWQNSFRNDGTVLERADIIVSTTGDPASDIQLDDTIRQLTLRPTLVFSWLEPYAAAAQALVIAGEGCLRCGCDEFGIFKGAATDWEGDTQQYEPGCSRSWQPYSELDATPAKAFVAATVLSVAESRPAESILCTWIGSERTREMHGGKLRDTWLLGHQNVKQGSVYQDNWPARCDQCRRAA